MATYYELCGGNKRLSEVVVAGSHDAAITNGSNNVQTQNLNVYEQAKAGVRVYDLRICAIANGDTAELVSYHSGWKKDNVKTVSGLSTSKLRVGSSSMGLDSILTQAASFVKDCPTEFLILKFDKCTNWGVIASRCVSLLDGVIYNQSGNINLKTLNELKGKVIVVFSEKGLEKAELDLGTPKMILRSSGISSFKNLYSKEEPGVYDPSYSGLQYLGKGGTSVAKFWKSSAGKTKENFKKQLKIMTEMASEVTNNGDVIGMVYWTSTGLIQSIKKRNNHMWKGGSDGMQGLWNDCLESHLNATCQARYKSGPVSYGTPFKSFLPNIVMIDFAEPIKCASIMGLNVIANTQIAKAIEVENKIWG